MKFNSDRAQVITKAFYALLVTHCFLSLRDWQLWCGATAVNFRPVWATMWVSPQHVGTVWLCTTVLALAASLLATWQTQSPRIRVFAAIVLFLHFAVEDSRDAIRHNEHGLLWVSVVFAFLPRWNLQRDYRRQLHTVRVFATGQAMLLLFYWMAGAIKVITAVVQAGRGERTLLHPDAGALIIAEWLLRGDGVSVMGHWLIQHRLLCWLAVLGGVVVEVLALLPVWRQWAQPWIASGLIAMHVGIGLSMDVWFPENVALLALLILAGPPLAVRKSKRLLRHQT